MGQLPDAPPAPPSDAVTRGTVRVTVLDPSGTGAPAVGANVVFLDPDGTLVKRVEVDTTLDVTIKGQDGTPGDGDIPAGTEDPMEAARAMVKRYSLPDN